MPNFFDLVNNIRPRRGVQINSLEQIKREGSPHYVWIVPAILAGANLAINVPDTFPASRKYTPLDSLEIVNNEAANDITVLVNGAGGDAHYCPAGTIRSISGGGVALYQVMVTNNGGLVTTLGLIRLTFQKEPLTIDKWFNRTGTIPVSR